jgi:hypothetical protein
MPRLVEKAGKALYSGWISQVHAQSGFTRGLRGSASRSLAGDVRPRAGPIRHPLRQFFKLTVSGSGQVQRLPV